MRDKLVCPQCRRRQYYCCGNPDCIDKTRVPKGKRAQVLLPNDGVACPYCGFAAHFDYWGEREMQLATLNTPE